MPNEYKDEYQKLAKLIDDVEYVMLTTVSENGRIHSRPMVTKQMDQEGNLWFLTGKSTLKVTEVNRNHQVNLAYSKPSDHQFISVSGSAELLDDKAKAKELWNPAYRAWFPNGLDDPDLGVLKVSIEEAEYWDSPSSGVVHLMGLAQAAVTGQRSDVGEKGHGKLNMTG